MKVRDHECSCGFKWTFPVELSIYTQALSGEKRPVCPRCRGSNGQYVVSSPAYEEEERKCLGDLK